MPTAHAKPALITPRQAEVLAWVARGKTAAEIATILGIAITTVEDHRQGVREALNGRTMAQCVAKAIVAGIIDGRQ
jgi:DNA-binding CsgD family transcriptional regulator